MIGVGIDVAKAKSMVAILSDDGEIINSCFYICRVVFKQKTKNREKFAKTLDKLPGM